MSGALKGDIKGMYMMGENPFLSDPNVNKVRKALAALDFLAVQDIFLTETAEFADVILPASSFFEKTGTYTNTDRRVQIGRPAMDPPGEARLDWEVICELSTRFGYPMSYDSPSEVFDELVELMPCYAGLSYDALSGPGKLYRSTTRTPTARWCCSTRRSPPTTGWPTWCPPSGRRPTRSCPTTSTRSCSPPGVCSSTGTPGR